MNSQPDSADAIVEAALELPPEARVAFLDQACAGDLALRQLAQGLLQVHERLSTLPARPALPAALPAPGASNHLAEKPGNHIGVDKTLEQIGEGGPGTPELIGRYKLLEKLGEGGCGVVYMAEQREPVRRRVALKVIKPGMDTRKVLARFEAERQALALMDHPNIARVLDAGATDTGRPYFVMELVRGIPVTRYCDENALTTEQRLRLFVQVCQAIQHAHQKGIIHRDVKPSNILVADHDGTPVPKVIDFGIAKATTDQPLTDKTLFTAFEQFIGTPAYMSPEQAKLSGIDIDTRSDIYSLGVLLYELLTGQTPFDARRLVEAGLDEVRRIIREEKPPRPSTRLHTLDHVRQTTVARCRHTEVPKLLHLIRGDLDWIVMKCLDKERARRYETANGLARDIQRHLNCEPVLARPPSRLYEFQKTVRRHKLGFAAVAAVLAALTIGAVGSSLEAKRARRAERNQANEKATAQQLLYNSLVEQARATRLVRRLGYRDQVFALLARARALDVPGRNLPDLRQEVLACMGDFVGLTPVTFTDFPTNLTSMACLAPSGNLAAFWLADGTLRLRELPHGKEVGRLMLTNGLWGLCFNFTGDKLFAVTGPILPDKTRALRQRRVCAWARDAGGQWRETDNRAAPGATKGLFSTESGVFVVTLEFVSASADHPGARNARFRLLDLPSGNLVPGREITRTIATGMEFAVSGDGSVLAVGSASGPWEPSGGILVNVYDWKSGQRLNQLPITNSGLLSLSDNGKYFSVLSDAGGAVYTVPSLDPVARFKESYPYAGPPACICGNTVALPIREQHRIRLWDLNRAEDIAPLVEPEDAAPVAFTAAGDSLLTVGATHARLYRLNPPEKIDLPAHTAPVPEVAFSPDGSRLASVGRDRVVRVCDALTGRTLWETNDLPGWGQSVGFSHDGRWLAIGIGTRDLVCIRDAHTGQRLLEVGTDARIQTWSAHFSPDGRFLATAAAVTNGIKIWRLVRGESGQTNGILKADLFKSWESGLSLLFSPDSRSVAFCGPFNEPQPSGEHDQATLWLWDFERSDQPRRLASGIMGGNLCEGFTPDGRQLVAMNTNYDIVTLEADTGKLIASCHAELPRIYVGVKPSPDCSKLAVRLNAASGGGVHILDAKSGKLLYALPSETGNVLWLAWSPDGRRLAVSRDNGNIAIWNLETVEQILAQLGLNP
jgi:serine/threonine protein kinase/WD40 repeat protein